MKNTGLLYSLVGLSFYLILQTGCTGNTSPEVTVPEKPKSLASATALINDRCPEMIDPETRLDSVLLNQEDQLIYYYTLPNQESSGINPSAFQAFLLTNIIDNVRSNPDMRMHRDSSITFVFNYRGRNGEHISEFSVAPERYH